MKKLFLTSGIIACMACPAFADPTVIYDENATGVQQGDCAYDPLGVYSGDVTVTAKWDKNWWEIVLDENSANGGLTNGTPTPMYAVVGTSGVYKAATTETDGTLTFSAQDLVTANNTLLTTPAAGITPNHTLHANDTTASSSANMPSTTGVQRTFNGYFSAATSGVQYTNGSTLLPAGANAANTATGDQTWYAQYACSTPTGLTDPTLYGYQFDGWTRDGVYNATTNPYLVYDSQTGQNDFCINTSDDLYANWTPNKHSISYNCGSTTSGNPGGQAPTTVSNIDFDSTINLAENTCTMQGYTFAGWSCSYNFGTKAAYSDTTTPNYAVGSTTGIRYSVDEDVVCTAVWSPATINITWDGNNATTFADDGTDSCFYDTNITLPTNPSRTGYEFKGWTVGQ